MRRTLLVQIYADSSPNDAAAIVRAVQSGLNDAMIIADVQATYDSAQDPNSPDYSRAAMWSPEPGNMSGHRR